MTQFISRKALNTASQQGLKYYVSTEVEQEFGASASQLSVNYYDEGLEYVGGDWVMPLGRTLSEIPAFLAAGLSGSIMLNHNVTNIAYSSTGVTVGSKRGGMSLRRILVWTLQAAVEQWNGLAAALHRFLYVLGAQTGAVTV